MTWIGPSGFSSTNTNTLISSAQLSASGFYTLNVVLGPCVASVSKYALVHPLPSFTMSSDVPCEGKTLHLNAGGVSNATLFIWQGPVSFTSNVQNPVLNQVNQTNAGLYYLTVHDANGCMSSSNQSVIIRPNPSLTPVSTTVCLNEPAMLSVSGAQSYVWTGPGSYVSYQGTTTIPSANSALPLTYTVMGTAANQCTAITTADLSTFELPVPSIAVLPTNRFCLNSTVQLQGQGGRVYDWTGPNGQVLSGQTVSFVALSSQYEGSYTLTVIDINNCKGYASEAIHLDPLPQGGLEASKQSGCVPFSSGFRFVAPGGSAVKANWQLEGSVFTSSSFTYHFGSPGDYAFYGNLMDTITQCVNTSSFMVSAYPLPVADFTYSPLKPIENFEEVLFTNTSKGQDQTVWHWFVADKAAVMDFKGPNTMYLFKESGYYSVALETSNAFGCKDSIVKTIEVDIDFTIYVPNAFTPNGDDLNEVFLPVSRGAKFYQMQIFNRWGQLIFSSTELSRGWDGTYNGQDCKEDSYVWKIKLSTQRGQEKLYSGNVLLTR